MGNLIGKSASGGFGITRTELLRSTENSRDFTNKLFQVMIAKTGLTPEDFLRLGRSQECSKYIFLMANSIGKLFRELQIRPKQDKDSGIIYFQKMTSIISETPESKNLCLIIAYFYIRIFQIFGALAMTVLDDPSAGQVLGALQYAPPVLGQDQQKRGFFGLRKPLPVPGARPILLQGGAMEGGAVQYISSREFQPMIAYFDKGQPITLGGRSYPNTFIFSALPHVMFIPDRMDGAVKRNLHIQLADSNYLDANMTLARSTSQQAIYKFSIGNFNYLNTSINPLQRIAINTKLKGYDVSFYIIQVQNDWVVIDKKKVDGEKRMGISNKTFIEALDERIQTVEVKISDLLNSRKQRKVRYDEYGNPIKGDDMLQGLYGQQQDSYDSYGRPKKDDDFLQGLLGQRQGAAGAAVQGRVAGYDVGMPKALENHYILDVLRGFTGQKTVSFCIARAFQLLDANSLFQPKPTVGRSGVCLARFDALPTSVPQSGRSLKEVPGIKALEQLYHTQPHFEQKDRSVVGISASDTAEYTDFLSNLTGLFGRPAAGGQTSKTLDSILAKDPNCAANATKHYLQLQDPKVIQQVVSTAKTLFAKQLAHTKRVIEFFNKRLFLIRKQGGSTMIDIHPVILKGGLTELAKISKEARGLLIEYYKGCEETYQKGAELIKGSKYTVL